MQNLLKERIAIKGFLTADVCSLFRFPSVGQCPNERVLLSHTPCALMRHAQGFKLFNSHIGLYVHLWLAPASLKYGGGFALYLNCLRPLMVAERLLRQTPVSPCRRDWSVCACVLTLGPQPAVSAQCSDLCRLTDAMGWAQGSPLRKPACNRVYHIFKTSSLTTR